MDNIDNFLTHLDYKKLSKFDTIHDFWKSRKNSTTADEGFENEELLNLVKDRIIVTLGKEPVSSDNYNNSINAF